MSLAHQIFVDNFDDPAIAAYRNLKDRELAQMGDLFIAEGRHVATRMLEAMPNQAVSVLTSEEKALSMAGLIPPDCPFYVGSKALLNQVIGYPFHSGVLAVGRRPASPDLASLIKSDQTTTTLLICEQVINHDNLGSLIRIATGFGVNGLILGEKSCDPYWRKSIRVSMGNIFRLPIYQSTCLNTTLQAIKASTNMTLIATTLDKNATPLTQISRSHLPHQGRQIGLLVGSESQGLSQQAISRCDLLATIPMHGGTDSLNITIATALFLYHLCS